MHTVYLVYLLVGLGFCVVLAALANLHFGHRPHGVHHGGTASHWGAHHVGAQHATSHGSHQAVREAEHGAGHAAGGILGLALSLLSPISLHELYTNQGIREDRSRYPTQG